MTFGGLPTRWEPSGPSRGLALVAPGRAYAPNAPLLDFARLALLQHGFTVQQLWWDSTTRGDEDPDAWVRRHVEAARRLARQLVAAGDADDLVSEAFAKVLVVLQRGDGPDLAFRAYLLTAVRRLHVDKIRAGALASNQLPLEQGIDPRGYDPAKEEERKLKEEEERKANEERDERPPQEHDLDEGPVGPTKREEQWAP